MAYIYQIWNDINDKLYIGKTYSSLEERFKQHCIDSKNKRNEKRPLYNAMNKYGTEHFFITLIEETDFPEEREQFWIKEKDTYHNGYNGTMGGEGRLHIDRELVIQLYHKYKNQKTVAKMMDCSPDTVRSILKEKEEKIYSRQEVCLEKSGKKVLMIDKDTNQILHLFLSAKEAGRFINKNSSHILDCCNKKRKTAYGYKWEFEEDYI